MIENLKIKLQIADRTYPMTIKSDQEESLRLGVARIQTLVKQFEENYTVKDKQDLLAMCAIQLASSLVSLEFNQKEKDLQLASELQSINMFLEAGTSRH